MIPKSLRFRLTAWHAAIFAGVFLLLGSLLCLYLGRELSRILLETQARRARQIGETLVAEVGRTGEAYVARSVEALYDPEKADRFIRISRPDGTALYRSGPPADQSFDPAQVALPPRAAAAEFNRRERLPDGRSLLVAAFRVASPAGGYVVEVGTPGEPVETLLRRAVVLLLLGLPVVVVAAAAGGYLLVGRALRPVAEISGKAEMITYQNLSERLPVARTGDELERLAVDLNRMIQRLDDAFQNSKRFVADASHELRTPLAVLRGELEEMAQDKLVTPHLADRLGSLLEETERLSKIVERLLVLSRLDAGEGQIEWGRFDLGALTASTADQMKLLADDRRIRVTCSIQKVVVGGDQGRIKEIIVNLLDNAIKYTREGGSITLLVWREGAHAYLEIADTGVGIAPEALPHVFDRFYRADPSRSRLAGGAGLGLAIVKAICAAHGGTVEAQSTVGHGSSFRVTLPLPPSTPPHPEHHYD